jgi:hypothetical protein
VIHVGFFAGFHHVVSHGNSRNMDVLPYSRRGIPVFVQASIPPACPSISRVFCTPHVVPDRSMA